METVNLDKRKKADIVNYIRDTSLSYTPEWKFDEQSPDMGTALALVYANMMSLTINKFNKILDKNRISFFNSIDAKVLPAVPSKGYVSFSLVADDVPGTEVEVGSRIVSNNGEEDIYFETVDDVYATPASVCEVYQVNDKLDSISHVFTNEAPNPFVVFDRTAENLQDHVLYISNEDALNIKSDAQIELSFYVNENVLISDNIVRYLANEDYALFEYATAEGVYEKFESVETLEGRIILVKGKDQPPFEKTNIEEFEETENYWIRLTVKKVEMLDNFSIMKIGIRSKSHDILPDVVVQADGVESSVDEFFPFNEQFSLYDEVYFASEEVLGKKGSKINLSFNMDFIRIPISTEEEEQINWKWIMKRADFQVEPEYDVTIDAIIWEYYNGQGWTRLFKDDKYKDLFSPEHGVIGQFKEVVFECPKDIQPTLVGAMETYCIRARILKASNLYKMKGYYISPLISNLALLYDYEKNDTVPDLLYVKNNMHSRFITSEEIKKKEVVFYPFSQVGSDVFSLYFGFNVAPVGSPIKIFFGMKENTNNNARLDWSYYDGNQFKELNIVDETESLSRSGLLTFVGNEDFARKDLFGKNLYWIRVSDRGNFYLNKRETISLPVIDSIYMNTVKVVNVDFKGDELFRMESYEENKSFKLLNNKICDVSVWVNEISTITADEQKKLDFSDRIKMEYDETGNLAGVWVNWSEVDDIIFSSAFDRVYTVDRNEGIICFGSGVCGRIPPVGREENIRVEYSCGGGEQSNLDVNKIDRMDRSIGFISEATNHDMILGGCDKESLESAVIRNAAILKNRHKAITSRDFEDLAKMVSTNIKKAKCFTGIDEHGERSPGTITLVVLQKDHEHGKNLFSEMKSKIYTDFKKKIPGSLTVARKFNIIEPTFVDVNFKIELVVRDFNLIFKVKQNVLNRLEQFLNPITGHFDGKGWDIGEFPSSIQIQNVIKDVKDVVYVKNVYTSTFIEGVQGKTETDMEQLRRNKFVLFINGNHDIVVSVE